MGAPITPLPTVGTVNNDSYSAQMQAYRDALTNVFIDQMNAIINSIDESIKYYWADSAARAAQTGMAEGEKGLQVDTQAIYVYESSAWVFKYNHNTALVGFFDDLKNQTGTDAPNFPLGIEEGAAWDLDGAAWFTNTLTNKAIMESGSNANGYYIKFADGTMIASITKQAAASAVAATGSLYYNTDSTKTLPATFIATPEAAPYIDCNAAVGVFPYVDSVTTTTVRVAVLATVSGVSGTTDTGCILFGRWKT